MKQYFLITGLILVHILGAQKQDNNPKYTKPLKDDFDITWGEEFKDASHAVAETFVGFLNEHGYIIKSKKNDYYLERVDKNLDFVSRVMLKLVYEKSNLNFYSVRIFNGKLLLFASNNDGKNEKKYLYVRQLDPETMNPVGDFVKISELDYSETISRKAGGFKFIQSPGAKFAMFLHQNPSNKNDFQGFGIKVFNKDMELVRAGDIVLPYKEDEFEVHRYDLDREGNVYILGSHVVDKESKDKILFNTQMELLKYSENSQDPMIIDLGGTGKQLFQTRLIFKGDSLFTIGFFGIDGVPGVKGCFKISIDKVTGNVLETKLKEFPMDFIKLNSTDKERKKMNEALDEGGDVGMTNLLIRGINHHHYDQIIVVAEEFHKDQIVIHKDQIVRQARPTEGGTSTRLDDEYTYDDIVLISFNRDFEILWYQKISKHQVTVNDGGYFSSFSYVQTPERLLFLFNDHVKNLTHIHSSEPEKFEKKENNSVVVAVTVDYEGNVGKKQLFSVKEEDFFIRPRVCGFGLDYAIVIYAKFNKMQRYGQVRLE